MSDIQKKNSKDMARISSRLMATFIFMTVLACRSNASPTGGSPSSSEGKNHQATGSCCRREQKFVTLGYDPTGQGEIRRDLGKCVKVCPRNADRATLRACITQSICYASRLVEETISLENGTRDISIVDECTCLSTTASSSCSVQRREHVYEQGTKYEKTINQGVCLGQSASNSSHSCQASSFKTATIRYPGGRRCVKVIKDCTSVSNGCSRRSRRVAVAASVQVLDSKDGLMKTVNKTMVLDVGICGGECSAGTSSRCFGIPPGCLYVRTGTRFCFPSSTEVVTYTSALTGKETNMAVIKQCSCATTSPSMRSNTIRQAIQQNGDNVLSILRSFRSQQR